MMLCDSFVTGNRILSDVISYTISKWAKILKENKPLTNYSPCTQRDKIKTA